MRILLVEDDDRIADFLTRALVSEGHTCTRLPTAETAIGVMQNGDFEFILLDLMLPGMSGLDLCREIRFRGVTLPIIMLTAVDSVDDTIQGLRAGADDYITKPFDIDELLVRIETVSRRLRPAMPAPTMLEIGCVTFNTESKVVMRDGQPVSLTAKELLILELLMEQPEKLFSRERIINNVWGASVDPLTNIIDVYIGRLRRKLGSEQSQFIETVRGMGYRIDHTLLTEQQRKPG